MQSFRNEDGKYFYISYHLVFCPRYRRKIFTIDKLEVRFKEMVNTVCDSYGISVTDIFCVQITVIFLLMFHLILARLELLQKLRARPVDGSWKK